jgi:hypothetical protein
MYVRTLCVFNVARGRGVRVKGDVTPAAVIPFPHSGFTLVLRWLYYKDARVRATTFKLLLMSHTNLYYIIYVAITIKVHTDIK